MNQPLQFTKTLTITLITISLFCHSIYASSSLESSLRLPIGTQDDTLKRVEIVEGKTNTPIPFQHQNRIDLRLEFEKHFGTDIIKVLEDVCYEKLGYMPIIFILGSCTYAVNEKGELDWNVIGDIDIKVYSDELVSEIQGEKIAINFFNILKTKRNIVVMLEESPGGSRIIDQNQKKFSIDITYHHKRWLATYSNIDYHLFQLYRIDSLCFGDTIMLNEILNKNLLLILKPTIKSYIDVINTANIYASKTLKQLYQLAYIRKKHLEYSWLLEEYKKLEKNFDKDMLKDDVKRAIKSLKIDEDLLFNELWELYIEPQQQNIQYVNKNNRTQL